MNATSNGCTHGEAGMNPCDSLIDPEAAIISVHSLVPPRLVESLGLAGLERLEETGGRPIRVFSIATDLPANDDKPIHE